MGSSETLNQRFLYIPRPALYASLIAHFAVLFGIDGRGLEAALDIESGALGREGQQVLGALGVDRRGVLVGPLDHPHEQVVVVSSDEVLSTIMAKAGGTVFLIDACRDNPFRNQASEKRQLRIRSRTMETLSLAELAKAQSGLSQMGNLRGKNTIVVFSTDPGNVAQDGNPGEGSPFANAVVRELGKRQSLDAAIRRSHEGEAAPLVEQPLFASAVVGGTHLPSALHTAGVAQSSTRVSTFMRNIDKSQWLRNPELSVIETKKDQSLGATFTLFADQVTVLDVKAETMDYLEDIFGGAIETLYSNAMTPAEVAELRQAGSVTHDPYPLRDAEQYPNEQLRLGAKVYRFQCSVCHTTAGVNGLTHLMSTWTLDQQRMNVAKLQHLKAFMPPFAGTAEELSALVQLIRWESEGRPADAQEARDPAALEQIQRWLDEAGTAPGGVKHGARGAGAGR